MVGELQRGGDEWLITLEKGCGQLQEIVEELSLLLKEESEIEGGAISLADWLNDTADDMLNIIWELEEMPHPQLEARINWTRADSMLATCKALFTEGRNLCNLLEERLEGEKEWKEAQAATKVATPTSATPTTSTSVT
ncbi:hypothetical protein CBR_g36374 [Chara braunii]|uniref:Uncharacterized protein n=1 Tax=Chara braunii TaxID=69332 RepID=A0A388LKU0_CHABU|nr:hypothetical protein CBR_g36374 [Chara braunii]|eukprot:GBG82845.1 hypothetical protein CBR_g36374 [Chara braunii]